MGVFSDPPPSRPTAPKPGQPSALPGVDSMMLPGQMLPGQVPGMPPGHLSDTGLPGGVPSALEAAMRMAQDPHGVTRGSMGLPPAQVSAPSPPVPSTGDGAAPRLTLKDYLPLMKPKSFGGSKSGVGMDAAAAMGAMGAYPGTSMGQVSKYTTTNILLPLDYYYINVSTVRITGIHFSIKLY